ncbi:MAG: hypothetical protein ACRC5V_00025 [Aeromonas sp.]
MGELFGTAAEIASVLAVGELGARIEDVPVGIDTTFGVSASGLLGMHVLTDEVQTLTPLRRGSWGVLSGLLSEVGKGGGENLLANLVGVLTFVVLTHSGELAYRHQESLICVAWVALGEKELEVLFCDKAFNALDILRVRVGSRADGVDKVIAVHGHGFYDWSERFVDCGDASSLL